jgi:cell division protein FtsL
MSAMIHDETRIYTRILTLLIMLAAVTVSGCLGLLWLRQKIETTAQATRSLETDIVKEERRLRYLDTKIAEIHQPLFLEQQIKRLGLKLRPPTEDQVVYIRWAAGQHSLYAAKGDTPATNREKDPFRHSIDLAVMESLVPID